MGFVVNRECVSSVQPEIWITVCNDVLYVVPLCVPRGENSLITAVGRISFPGHSVCDLWSTVRYWI